MNKQRILYVEDNDDNIFMLKTRLISKGYEVIIAKDGQTGVDIAKREKPDLILMDVGLPILDGYSAMRLIRSDPEIQDIPIIAITAHVMSTDKDKAFAAGANEYEPKPINFNILLDKIASLLNSAKG